MAETTSAAGREPVSAGDGAAAPSRRVRRTRGVVLEGYRLAARHLVVLSVPPVVLLVPFGAMLSMILIAVAGRDGRIVNGDLRPWSASPALTGVAIGGIVLALPLIAAATGAVIIMIGELSAGRPVRSRAALRAAMRRWGAIASLLLVVLTAVAAAGAAGGELGVHHARMGIAATVALLLAGAWLWTTLPIALLDGCGPLRAVARAYTACKGRRARVTGALVLGVVILPALATATARWAAAPLSGVPHTVVVQILTAVTGVLSLPFEAAVITLAAARGAYPFGPGRRVDEGPPPILAQVAVRSPAGDSRARRPPVRRLVLPVAALALPGLLYGGYLRLNPLHLTRTSDHVLSRTFDRDAVALHLLRGDRPAALEMDRLHMWVCRDRRCGEHRLHSTDLSVGGSVAAEAGSVTLADGSVAVPVWSSGRGRPGGPPVRELRLVRCGATGCPPRVGSPVIERGLGDGNAAAAATERGGELLIAAVVTPPRYGAARLRIIRCADVRCVTPRAVTPARLPVLSSMVWVGLHSRPVAIAIGRHGRPVVAYEDADSGEVTVVSCDTGGCRRPRVSHPVPPVLSHGLEDDPYVDGVDVEVPPNDLPVIGYRDPRSGTARLLRCRTPDCARTDGVALTGPGFWRPWPALTLDRDGRPLAATFDLVSRRVVFVACRDFACTRRTSVPLAPIESGPGHLDLAVGADRRPRVLWSDEPPEKFVFFPQGRLHLTTCELPRCGV